VIVKRISACAAVALTCALVSGVVAYANGGSSIASAPDVPIDQQVTSGWTNQKIGADYGEYWRVNLKAHDRLVIDYAVQQDSCGYLYVWLYAPTVTDASIHQGHTWISRGHAGADGEGEFAWVANFGGRWALEFQGCQTMSFQFAAHVQQFTHTTLSVPRVVAARHRLQIRGTVTGVSAGRVTISVTSAKDWERQAEANISKRGTFSWSTRVGAAGSYKVKAAYSGDDAHRSSQAVAAVHAVG
jgi:hypothetical protein